MRRRVGSKKASWGPGPGAIHASPGYSHHSRAQRWPGGPGCGSVDSRRLACPLQLFCKASTASQSQSAWALGSIQGGVSVGQSVGAGSWPWRLTVSRVVLWPKALAFQTGKKEEQSCGCWRSSRLEDGVLPLSLRARLRRSGELSARV